MMIEDVRPEGCICELCSDISPNREDIRTKFGYTMLNVMPIHDLIKAMPSLVWELLIRGADKCLKI